MIRLKYRILAIILVVITLVLFVTCHKGSNFFTHHTKANASIKGIVFCIDDYYVEDFYKPEHYKYIQQAGIKMTYFICRYHQLNNKRKEIIHRFYTDGHEIAFHGTHHINAVNYLKNHSIEEYINYEILPDLTLMKQQGYNVNDFSYPYGHSTLELDSILLTRYFYFIKLGSINEAGLYTLNEDKRIIRAFPLDDRYWKLYHIDMKKVLALIDSADKNNKIIVFYSHRLEDEYNDNVNSTWFDKFRMIMDYARQKGFHFYTLQDLQKMDKHAAKIILNTQQYYRKKTTMHKLHFE